MALNVSRQQSRLQHQATFEIIRQLGSGAHADVFLALDHQSLEHVALKIISDSRFHLLNVRELKIAKMLPPHENVIRSFNCYRGDGNKVILVQEYASNGDLYDLIDSESLSVVLKHQIFTHLIRGVAHLHRHGFVHRDIKPENVVVSKNYVAKLCDLGMAQRDGSLFSYGSGTSSYMAPELFDDQHPLITRPCHDVWALGVTLYVLLVGEFPWGIASMSDPNYVDFVTGECVLGRWAEFSDDLLQLFCEMFAPESRRCTLEQILARSWFEFFRPTQHAWQRKPDSFRINERRSVRKEYLLKRCSLPTLEITC